MTPKEKWQMRLNGATFQQIADACGATKQSVHKTIADYENKKINRRRGRKFCYNKIVFEGIYEHFEKNEEETLSSFAMSVWGSNHTGLKTQVMKNFLTGASDSHLTISQIKRICEICGKPFEEVFKERKEGAE